MLVAHVAGIPVEETALSFGPVLVAGGGVATLKLRERMRAGRRRVASARGPSRSRRRG